MADFATHAARMDAGVDDRLGDSILYAVSGATGGAYVAMKGRVLPSEPAADYKQQDEMRGTWRLKIAKALVPMPSKNDRLQCAAVLGDLVYRPMSKEPYHSGRYWLVDLQKV